MRRPAPLRSRPLPALVLAALLLPLASPVHAEEPLPRMSGVSPAEQWPLPGGYLNAAIADELQALVAHAGLAGVMPDLARRPLAPEEARRLLHVVLGAEGKFRNQGPRRVLCQLLAEIAKNPKRLDLLALGRILSGYRHILIVRGDGYFARVLDGEAIQRAGTVEFDPALGALRASTYLVGALYFNKEGGLYQLDEETQRTLGLAGELSLEHGLGPLDDVLDGVEDSLGATVRGLAELIREPMRAIEGLKHLPEAVITLVRSSPEYWERFKEMPQGDQIREVSRLVTELVLLEGSVKGVIAGAKGARAAYVLGKQALDEAAKALAKGTAASAWAAGGKGSVLALIPTLTADGRLIWETVVVPVEQLADAAKLGLGAGGELGASGAFILKMGAGQGGQGGSGRSGDNNGKGSGLREKARGQAEAEGTSDVGLEEWQPPSDWRLPTNGKWEREAARGNCRFTPDNPDLLGLKPGETIEFRRGWADFSPWSRGEFEVPTLDGSDADFARIYRYISEMKGWLKPDGTPNAAAARRWLRDQGLSPYHAGGYKVQLIPESLHDNIRHTGGAFELRNMKK